MFPYSRTMLVLFAAVTLAACGKNESVAEPSAAPAAAAEPSAPAAPAETATATMADSSDAIGIAACDDYLDKYAACVADKVPAETRDVLKTSLEQTRDAWRSALSSGTSRSDLEAACKTMHDSARAAMGAYGCTDF